MIISYRSMRYSIENHDDTNQERENYYFKFALILHVFVMPNPVDPLVIMAEPRATYRERYGSEQNKLKKQPSRFIRAEENSFDLDYPSVKVPPEWYDVKPTIYIRIISVTVPVEDGSVCIHPYPIDTEDSTAVKDPGNNALYFPITNDDVLRGHKSFRLIRRKLLQSELKMYGPLRIFDSNGQYLPSLNSKSRSKDLIRFCRLWQSKLAFTQAMQVSEKTFKSFPATTVFSQVMSDDHYQPRDENKGSGSDPSCDGDDTSLMCVPDHGQWQGGDKVLMILSKLDRKKPFRVYFDFVESNQKIYIEYELVDAKTIHCKTPPCLSNFSDQDHIVPIVVLQDDQIIGTCEFVYLANRSSTTQFSFTQSDGLTDASGSASYSNASSSTLDTWFSDEL